MTEFNEIHQINLESLDINDQNIVAIPLETPKCGIPNPGALCYMIAMLHQLYMMPLFKEKLYHINSNNLIIIHLKLLFQSLDNQNNLKSSFYEFIKVFQKIEGKIFKIDDQYDTSVFLRYLLVNMVDKNDGVWFDSIIAGKLLHKREIMNKNNENNNENNEIKNENSMKTEYIKPFYFIDLNIFENIIDSFNSFIEPMIIDYLWKINNENINHKTLYSVIFTNLPKYLILHLKRFEFNKIDFKVNKLKNKCVFPLILDLKSYFQLQNDIIEKNIDSNVTNDIINSQNVCENNENNENSNIFYELTGIVIHDGNAQTGHYYSIIKNRMNQKWFLFNDELIREYNFSESDLIERCYGGESYEMSDVDYDSDDSDYDDDDEPPEGSCNAYMLIYDLIL